MEGDLYVFTAESCETFSCRWKPGFWVKDRWPALVDAKASVHLRENQIINVLCVSTLF